jgi:hypothetical protein
MDLLRKKGIRLTKKQDGLRRRVLKITYLKKKILNRTLKLHRLFLALGKKDERFKAFLFFT